MKRHELIDGPLAAEFDGPIRAYLTDAGVRCAEHFDSDATAYVEAQRHQQTEQGQTVWNVNGQVQYATGEHAQQVINVGRRRKTSPWPCGAWPTWRRGSALPCRETIWRRSPRRPRVISSENGPRASLPTASWTACALSPVEPATRP